MTDLNICLVQCNLTWEDAEANRTHLDTLLDGLQEGTHLVILPEMFTTGFSMHPERLAETMEGPSVRWMKHQAKTRRVILCGSLIIQENDAYVNRLLWVMPNGQLACYDKRHLFSFAGEDQKFLAGNKRLIAQVNGWRICLMVCYDLRFPVWSRQSPPASEGVESAPRYDLLVYCANWPESRIHAWNTLLPARAIENQCYVAGVNRVGTDGLGHLHPGDSAVIDPLGHVLGRLKDQETLHHETLSGSHIMQVRETYPFLDDADTFVIY